MKPSGLQKQLLPCALPGPGGVPPWQHGFPHHCFLVQFQVEAGSATGCQLTHSSLYFSISLGLIWRFCLDSRQCHLAMTYVVASTENMKNSNWITMLISVKGVLVSLFSLGTFFHVSFHSCLSYTFLSKFANNWVSLQIPVSKALLATLAISCPTIFHWNS